MKFMDVGSVFGIFTIMFFLGIKPIVGGTVGAVTSTPPPTTTTITENWAQRRHATMPTPVII
jgi:hypothetical protein